MKTLTVRPYQPKDRKQWDAFCMASKNATFLFQRDFMEYHKNRFEDYSLMVFEAEKLVAILPAHKLDNTLYSHNGLTYGGLVIAEGAKLQKTISIFAEVLKTLDSNGITSLELKLIPRIYHSRPADEMDYIMFLTKAELFKREVASVIDMSQDLKIQSNRKEGVKKGKQHGLRIEEGEFESFWASVLEPILKSQFDTAPVHSSEEIKMLAKSFPQKIKQFNVYHDDVIVAGTTIFQTETVAHTQYIASNEQRQELGSLDFLFDYLLKQVYMDKRFFSFGTSNSNNGRTLNTGLNFWKSCFGARTIIHDAYRVDTSQYHLLNEALS